MCIVECEDVVNVLCVPVVRGHSTTVIHNTGSYLKKIVVNFLFPKRKWALLVRTLFLALISNVVDQFTGEVLKKIATGY